MGDFYMPALIILPLSAIVFFVLAGKRVLPVPGNQRPRLDLAGKIINILLLLLYFPLSVLGFFSGMVSEGFMYDRTFMQGFLCDLIGIVGLCTAFVYIGGLYLSLKLRRCGRSLESFLWQFAGIGWLIFDLGLMAVLYAL